MYNYPQYKEKDQQKVIEFMRNHSFVTLIGSYKTGRSVASQIPVLIHEKEGRLFLRGHIARKSDHHHAFEENPGVLVLFTGPHVYVSGTWYTGNPHQASTWNYISVHARGKMKFTTDDELIQLLRDLSLFYEKNNKSSTTIYDNLPKEYLDKLVHAILGFEIEVTELDNVYKLSQNRDELSYDNIINELKKQADVDGQEIGKIMEVRKLSIFPK